ncbi:hypothetical protein A3758_10040 [Oleiphilus sp. HI0118]|nr:hypothetical protein A3758_22260 [Oleiphilus sp. HI0118]KZZ54098.1 hypothetical protein A3758_10040 [Oleiphilus sp. HI0118]
MRAYFKLHPIRAIMSTLFCSVLLNISAAQAEDDVIVIEGTRIRGNQESPTILYLVPWQAPEVVALDAPAAGLAITRALQPLERSEFKRLIKYHQHFKQATDEIRLGAQSNHDSTSDGQP